MNPFKKLYMVDDITVLKKSHQSRANLYGKHTGRENWVNAVPEIIEDSRGKTLKILGHDVMSSFEVHYMKALGDVVTRNGGNVLNVGYGLGYLDIAIESHREFRNLKEHYIIEINRHIASTAEENLPNCHVICADWHEAIHEFEENQFDGIVYDGYPLKFGDVHRDGVEFIEHVIHKRILKKGGVLTFYADAIEQFGANFLAHLNDLGFSEVTTQKMENIQPPEGIEYWCHDHFLVPRLIF